MLMCKKKSLIYSLISILFPVLIIIFLVITLITDKYIETDDAELLTFLINLPKDKDCLNSINKRIDKDSYIDYYKIKDKIKVQ